MAEPALEIMRLKNDFYRDGFRKVLILLAGLLTAIILLILTSLYLFLAKPKPVSFATADEWRIIAPVPLNQAYLSTADLLQWVSDVLPKVFTFDFINYNDQLKQNMPYFTNDGWKHYNDTVNVFASSNAVATSKLFINGIPAAGPYILNQGLLNGRYGWWVQMPIDLHYRNYQRGYVETLTIQALITRVPTDNNIAGVAIDNVIVVKKAYQGQAGLNG